MVDTEAYYSMKEHIDLKPNLGVIGDITAYGVPECLCSVSLNSKQSSIHPKKSKLSSCDDIYPETKTAPTEHQYFLCAFSTRVYDFKTRFWVDWNWCLLTCYGTNFIVDSNLIEYMISII